MVKARLIRSSALVVAFAVLFAGAASQEPSQETRLKSVLRDLSEAQYDFRGCDRESNRVSDFWTAEVTGLHKAIEPAPAEQDFRANDRDWCRVNDFWGGLPELYPMTGAAVDPHVKDPPK